MEKTSTDPSVISKSVRDYWTSVFNAEEEEGLVL